MRTVLGRADSAGKVTDKLELIPPAVVADGTRAVKQKRNVGRGTAGTVVVPHRHDDRVDWLCVFGFRKHLVLDVVKLSEGHVGEETVVVLLVLERVVSEARHPVGTAGAVHQASRHFVFGLEPDGVLVERRGCVVPFVFPADQALAAALRLQLPVLVEFSVDNGHVQFPGFVVQVLVQIALWTVGRQRLVTFGDEQLKPGCAGFVVPPRRQRLQRFVRASVHHFVAVLYKEHLGGATLVVPLKRQVCPGVMIAIWLSERQGVGLVLGERGVEDANSLVLLFRPASELFKPAVLVLHHRVLSGPTGNCVDKSVDVNLVVSSLNFAGFATFLVDFFAVWSSSQAAIFVKIAQVSLDLTSLTVGECCVKHEGASRAVRRRRFDTAAGRSCKKKVPVGVWCGWWGGRE